MKLNGAERTLALDCLLAGGDDYELLFTAPPAAAQRIAEIAAALALKLTRIGSIVDSAGLAILDERGIALPTVPRAYDHFAVS